MKNVLIIDGALNCVYDIFAFTNEQFSLVFPAKGQNIEFIEDVEKRLGKRRLAELNKDLWRQRVNKKDVKGIHGTLFYQLKFKKKYYPTKKDEEAINPDGSKLRA